MPALADKVETWLDTKRDWPLLVSSIAKGWLKEGLHDRCITRDLKWGVPVDRPGFDGKVFYVQVRRALIEYIGATKEWADQAPGERDSRSWWFDAVDVSYVEFMSKDNEPYNTVSFPATILGSGENWKLVDYIKGFSWLNFYGGKFSTSQKRGIFLDQALAEYPADYWRYWLVANAPETDDASFTFSGFGGVCNYDLADTFGNFVNRCLRFASARFGDDVPAGGEFGAMEAELAENLQAVLSRYTASLDGMWVAPRRGGGAARAAGTRKCLYRPRCAVDRDQDGQRSRRRNLAGGDQSGAALRDRRRADHSRHLRPSARQPRGRDRRGRAILADGMRRRRCMRCRRATLRGAGAAVQEDRAGGDRRPVATLRRRGGGGRQPRRRRESAPVFAGANSAPKSSIPPLAGMAIAPRRGFRLLPCGAGPRPADQAKSRLSARRGAAMLPYWLVRPHRWRF